MTDNPLYTHEFHGDYDLISIGELQLEEGGTIPDCILAVATFGELNAAKDNAILIPTWYSGTRQIWRDAYIGPEHAISRPRWAGSRPRPSSCPLTKISCSRCGTVHPNRH